MDILASPLVLTKLRALSVRPRTIPRTRLVDYLSAGEHANLILVCAPAGYGKTTLLTEWAQRLVEKNTAVAWYALDPGDDAPVPFGAYLVGSFIQALGPMPELTQVAQLLRSSAEVDLERMLPAVINAVLTSGRECALVLDDYHLITDPAIHRSVAFLVERCPENLRVAIGSRSDPPLPLARWRARGRLTEIRSAGLRFTKDESVQFLNEVMRLDLPPGRIDDLLERTEGWAAGLQLAALALQSPPKQVKNGALHDRAQEDNGFSFTGTHRFLAGYLIDEVFGSQPEEIQTFLLSTSILERLCAPLCGALVGDAPKSAGLLKQLEQANLFVIPLDDQGEWYRYHHLFRDFLLSRLQALRPKSIAALHRAASEWLSSKGFLREAASHAFQTQDWEYAATFVEQHSFTLIVHSELATIYEWCSTFPEVVMQAHPMLCLMQGLSLAFRFRRRNRERIEARLRQVDLAIAAEGSTQGARELFEMAAVVRTFLQMAPDRDANPREQLAAAQKVADFYPEGDVGQFTGLLTMGYASLALNEPQAAGQSFEIARRLAVRGQLFFGIVESTFHLARLAFSQGQLQRAAELCLQTQAEIASMLPHPGDLPAVGCLDIVLGCVRMEQDQLHEAEEHLLNGLQRMGAGMNPYYLMTAYLAIFRLYEIEGKSEDALKYLDRMDTAWPDIEFCTRGLRVMHALRESPEDPGARRAARGWVEDLAPVFSSAAPPGMGPFGAAEVYHIAAVTWLRAQIATGSPRNVHPFLEGLIEVAAAHHLTSRLIELTLLEAAARQSEGNLDQAYTMAERAITLAQAESYIRIFDQVPALTHLLVEVQRQEGDRPFLTRILAVIAPRSEAAAPGEPAISSRAVMSSLNPLGAGLLETLSQRELEVLALIARGATNQAIADQLVITVGTVKSHINHILGKLEARNRMEAVARARELGLLLS